MVCPAGVYHKDTMANDAVGIMSVLGMKQAHIVGSLLSVEMLHAAAHFDKVVPYFTQGMDKVEPAKITARTRSCRWGRGRQTGDRQAASHAPKGLAREQPSDRLKPYRKCQLVSSRCPDAVTAMTAPTAARAAARLRFDEEEDDRNLH